MAVNGPVNDGGPAFPVTLFDGQDLGDGTANGMTLRDYFAAKFAHAELMTCGVSGPACDALIEAIGQTGESPENYMARSAYDLADAMIRARENITGATK